MLHDIILLHFKLFGKEKEHNGFMHRCQRRWQTRKFIHYAHELKVIDWLPA